MSGTVLNTSVPVINCTSTTTNLSDCPEAYGEDYSQAGSPCSPGEKYIREGNHTAACAGPHARVGERFLEELWTAENPRWSGFS